MNDGAASTVRVWRPAVAHRIIMLVAALAYGLVLAARSGDLAANWRSYSGAIAIIILALLPGRWRLSVVMASVVCGLLLTHVVFNLLGWAN